MSDPLNNKIIDEYLKTKEGQKLTNKIAKGFYEELVQSGQIIPNIMSTEQKQLAFFNSMTDVIEGKAKLTKKINFKDMLLSEARKYSNFGNLELSIFMYATWVEHLLNELVICLAKRKKITNKEIKQIIRCTNFSQKTTWVWKLLDAPMIATKHLSILIKLFEKRNEFAHYKWPELEIGDTTNMKEIKCLIEEIEKSTKYLQALKRRIFFGQKNLQIK